MLLGREVKFMQVKCIGHFFLLITSYSFLVVSFITMCHWLSIQIASSAHTAHHACVLMVEFQSLDRITWSQPCCSPHTLWRVVMISWLMMTSPPLSSPSLITGSKADERSGKTPQLHQPDTDEETARV